MIKNKVDEMYLQLGWIDRATDKQLSKLVTNGIFNIRDRTSVDHFRLKMKKTNLQDMTKQIINRMKYLIEWETKLVLRRKLNPKLVNVNILEHPVIKNRDNLTTAHLIQKCKEKNVMHNTKKSNILKNIEQVYCEKVLADEKKLGIEFKELKFGESYINDFYKHGKLLKKKIYEHTKNIGLHLPRSKHQIKIMDIDIEIMKNIIINDEEDYNYFHNMTRKIINEPFNGRL